ncbi:hypothetical protein [Xylanibacter muris]|uniref:Peptidylprolyl isomerase n=1 Tax=Xylanibacter muris TaxID=2736290 RepID=A0ABX2ARW2_9BACT|nr:hypothetical protein [Xylanibacter muris]NPD92696.1 hypothetical protein [Xylanibacter muris]
MKRIIISVMAMLTMSLAFAASKSDLVAVNTVAETGLAENAGVYDININIRKLGEVLGLTFSQMESVYYVQRTFAQEMAAAELVGSSEGKILANDAIEKNLRCMSYILNKEQYDKYLVLFNNTLNNINLSY